MEKPVNNSANLKPNIYKPINERPFTRTTKIEINNELNINDLYLVIKLSDIPDSILCSS